MAADVHYALLLYVWPCSRLFLGISFSLFSPLLFEAGTVIIPMLQRREQDRERYRNKTGVTYTGYLARPWHPELLKSMSLPFPE